MELRLRPVGQPIRSGAHRLGPWGAPIGSAALSPRAAGPSPPEASLQEALSALRLRTRSTTRSTPWHTPCRPGCRPSRHGSATTHPIDPSRPPSGQHHARYGRLPLLHVCSACPPAPPPRSVGARPRSGLGSGPRYMTRVTLFCTRFACNSRMSVCFLTRATCKNVRQNLIPRATAYRSRQPGGDGRHHPLAAAAGGRSPGPRRGRAVRALPLGSGRCGAGGYRGGGGGGTTPAEEGGGAGGCGVAGRQTPPPWTSWRKVEADRPIWCAGLRTLPIVPNPPKFAEPVCVPAHPLLHLVASFVSRAFVQWVCRAPGSRAVQGR